MNVEYDKWAEVYDLVYGHYTDDIPFYLNAAKASNGKVLEIACGTGRVYLELLKAKVDAYGLDNSKRMLEMLEKKAGGLEFKTNIRLADMRDFRINQQFALIIIPFRAFMHNLTVEDQIKTLKSCRRHLTANGKLILNFFFPNPEVIVNNYGREKLERTVMSGDKRLELKTEAHYVDEPEQIIEFTSTLMSNNETQWSGSGRLALIYKKEFELLLRLAGFKKWRVYGGFNYEQLTNSKQEMVWVVEK